MHGIEFFIPFLSFLSASVGQLGPWAEPRMVDGGKDSPTLTGSRIKKDSPALNWP